MTLMNFTQVDFDRMHRHFRTNFINSLSGFKSVNLCGTRNASGSTNLAIMSSVVHVGARPALMGMVIRPPVVARHTLTNIVDTGYYTLNHIQERFVVRAHQTSAKYGDSISEFQETGLREWYSEHLPAPYVAEAHVRIGLRFRDRIDISLNGTVFVIGEVVETFVPANCVEPDGYLDLCKAKSVTVAGLDAYHRTERIDRLARAHPRTSELSTTA